LLLVLLLVAHQSKVVPQVVADVLPVRVMEYCLPVGSSPVQAPPPSQLLSQQHP
jgi:hypothetical protein